MDTKELTDELYDLIVGLAGIDDIHPMLDRNSITNQWVTNSSGEINIEIDDEMYIIKVSKAAYNWFKEG